MIEIEDKDYFINIIRLTLGVGLGILTFYVLSSFLGSSFDFLQSSILAKDGGSPPFFRQLFFISIILAVGGLSTFVAVFVAKPYPKRAAQVVSILIGLWIGGILWFLNFWILLILGAVVANYIISLKISYQSKRIMSRIRDLAKEVDSMQKP